MTLWDLDRGYERKIGDVDIAEVLSILDQKAPPGHYAMLAAQQARILAQYQQRLASLTKQGTPETYTPIAGFGGQQSSKEIILRAIKKAKEKTRGQPSHDAACSTDRTQQIEPPLAPATIAVFPLAKNSFSVLKQIYSDAGEKNLATAPWQDFLNMMVDVSFAIETINGSAHFSSWQIVVGLSFTDHIPTPCFRHNT